MVRGRGSHHRWRRARPWWPDWPPPPRRLAPPPAARTAAAAPGAPGAPSYFDLARKDCLGTAAGRGSKVWYTVADGVLSDVYEPTIDNTDVSTLQYVVTDGATFTDLQTRDMTYTVAADPTGMACTVTSTDAKHGFRLVTTYITDPASDTVLMQHPAAGAARVRHQPGPPAPVRPARRPRQRQRRRRERQRGRQLRRGGLQRGPGHLQHEHRHQRGQPGLRGAHLHGPGRHVRAGRERRLRGHRQRRPDPARHRARAHALHLGARTATSWPPRT